MSDHLKKVQSGDPLKIPSARFNAMNDAAKTFDTFNFARLGS